MKIVVRVNGKTVIEFGWMHIGFAIVCLVIGFFCFAFWAISI